MKHSYLPKLLFLLLFLCAGITGALAQTTGSVSGRVLDEKNQGLPGVTVLIEGSTLGNTTNSDGAYLLQGIPAGPQTLVISFVGFNTQRKVITIVAGQNVVVDATMAENTTLLSEAVVVGYGTQQRRQLTGAVSEIDSKAFTNTPLPSFDAGLQGRAAGVQVVQSSGAPGAAVRVRVRGQSSVSGGADPLYVIDGVVVNNGDFSSKNYGATSAIPLNPLAAINPDEIESVSVLKDAAAGAIYGARAANGVVLITTKRGKAGKTQFSLNYSIGTQTPARKLDILSGPQWREVYREAYTNDSIAGLRPALPTNINGVNLGSAPNNRRFLFGSTTDTDWYEEVFRTGRVQDVSLSASGGSDKTKFYINGAFNRNESMLRGNTFQRGSLRLNLDNEATEKLTLGTQIGLYFTDNTQVRTSYNGGLGAAQSNALPIFPVRNANGTYFGTQFANTGNNPTAQLDDRFNTQNLRTLTNVYFNYKILPGLSFRPQVSLDFLDQYERFYFSPTNRYYQNTGLGSLDERHVNFYNVQGNAVLNYTKDINENNRISVIGGSELQYNTQRDIGFYTASGGAGFLNPLLNQSTASISYDPRVPTAQRVGPAVGGYNSVDFYRFASFFSRVNYSLLNRYTAELSLRADGSSRFGPNKRFGFFPAASASWVLAEETFIKDIAVISQLKLRGSIGLTGNSELGSNFSFLGTTTPESNVYLGLNGSRLTRINNPDLSWETNRSLDVALDFGLIQNRLTGTVAYYNKRGTDILLNQAVQISALGLGRTPANSDVVIRNQGWEFELTSRNVANDKFTWTTSLNLSANYNMVLDAAGLAPDAFESGPGDARIIQGYPVGTNFLAEYAGVDPETGDGLIRALDGSLIRLNKDTPASAQQNNRRPVGTPFPKLQGGLDNTLTFMGVDLSFLLVGSYGNTIYDDAGKYQNGGRIGSWNQTTRILDRWQKPGDNTDIPRLTLRPFNPDQNNTTQWLYDASYLRLRTMQLGYTLPGSLTERMHVTRLRVYVTGTNLLTFTKFPGWDPEVTRYADAGDNTGRNNQANISFSAPYLATPQARTLQVGFNLGF
ncbi:TonB-dependent receptor [Hymenobacter sp. BT175]|uniref:SusC/RagA family TonB-linked outer membrane protein n=1 Tax=Hymenobacter translucens TaxID=2886507 RepID=UPI001D0E13CA|nr:TonB-dependent receptor [Hymenobacter translucens]MCC2545304.1 TonB-dependent receptor [Hymenobacter translucens]